MGNAQVAHDGLRLHIIAESLTDNRTRATWTSSRLSGQVNSPHLSVSDSAMMHQVRKGWIFARDPGPDCKFPGGVGLVFAQKDQRIHRQRALRRNPCSQQTEQGHREHYAGQDERIARRCLIDDEGEDAGRQDPKA